MGDPFQKYILLSAYDLQLSLTKGRLSIVVMQHCTNAVFQAKITQQIITKKYTIFANVEEMFKYLSESGVKEKAIKIQQSGEITFEYHSTTDDSPKKIKIQPKTYLIETSQIQDPEIKCEQLSKMLKGMRNLILQQKNSSKDQEISALIKKNKQIEAQMVYLRQLITVLKEKNNEINRGQSKVDHWEQLSSMSLRFGKRIGLSINKNNIFFNQFKLNGDQIKKVCQQVEWRSLLSYQKLPQNGKFHFTIKVIKSQFNALIIGIVPSSYVITDQLMSSRAIGFNLATGKILDSKNSKTEGANVWREGGQAASKGKQIQILVHVDCQEGRIRWLENSRVMAEGIINKAETEGFVAYFSFLHCGDELKLNFHSDSLWEK